jgi:hypothetical protein
MLLLEEELMPGRLVLLSGGGTVALTLTSTPTLALLTPCGSAEGMGTLLESCSSCGSRLKRVGGGETAAGAPCGPAAGLQLVLVLRGALAVESLSGEGAGCGGASEEAGGGLAPDSRPRALSGMLMFSCCRLRGGSAPAGKGHALGQQAPGKG